MKPSLRSAPFPSILLLALLVTTIGCAGSRKARYMTSYVDPSYSGRHFKSFIVTYDTTALDLRQRIEEELVECLIDEGYVAYAAGSLTPPTRKWSDSAIAVRLRTSGAETELRIKLEHIETRTEHVPGKTITRNTTTLKSEQELPPPADTSATKNPSKKPETIESESRVTTTSVVETRDPYSYSYDVRRVSVELTNLATGETIWIGSDTQSGYFGDDAGWIARDIVGQLRLDGLLAR